MKMKTTQFALIPVGGTFEKEFDGRTLTYRKIDENKAQVTRDPLSKYVGCVYVMPMQQEVVTGAGLTRREALNLLKIGIEPEAVSLR